MELLVIDSEVMGEFMDHRDRDLFTQLGLISAPAGEWPAEDGDPIRERPRRPAAVAFGERHPFVESEEFRLPLRRLIVDQDHQIVHHVHELDRHGVERIGDGPVEVLRAQRQRPPTLGRGHDGTIASVRVTVRVRPGASRTRVGGRYGTGDVLTVSVAARAVDGAATAAVCRAVAEAFGLRARDVSVVTGATARTKVLEVADSP